MAKRYAIYIDRFSAGLDDLTRRQQRDPLEVLRVLARTGRFSVFEATDHPGIARTMDLIYERGYVRDIGHAFPWNEVELTTEGRALLDAAAKEQHA